MVELCELVSVRRVRIYLSRRSLIKRQVRLIYVFWYFCFCKINKNARTLFPFCIVHNFAICNTIYIYIYIYTHIYIYIFKIYLYLSTAKEDTFESSRANEARREYFSRSDVVFLILPWSSLHLLRFLYLTTIAITRQTHRACALLNEFRTFSSRSVAFGRLEDIRKSAQVSLSKV